MIENRKIASLTPVDPVGRLAEGLSGSEARGLTRDRWHLLPELSI